MLSGLSLLTLRGLGAHALPEITDRITALAAERGIRLLPSASGESQICCLLPSAQAALLHSHLKDDCAELPMSEWLAQIEMREQTALVSIIGRGIADDAGFLSRVVTLLDEQAIPVYRVAAGTADLSISLVVDASHAEQALRVVHVLTGSAQDACSVPLELCVGGEHSPMSVASGKTREQIAHFVRETLVRQGQLSCAPGLIADEDYLFSERLNMTSLGLINVVMAIEEGLGRSLGDELLIQARSGTVGDLIDWIDIACRSASTPQPQGSSVPRVAAQM